MNKCVERGLLLDEEPIKIATDEKEEQASGGLELDHSLSKLWVKYNRNVLKYSDKDIVQNGSLLTDKHIGLAQSLIMEQFPKIGGLCSTLLQERYHNLPPKSV